MNNRYIAALVLFVLVFISFHVGMSYAARKPDVTSYDAELLQNAIGFNIKWQSEYPVTLIRISAGNKSQKFELDEYDDNIRDPRGYHGESSLVVDIDMLGFFDKYVSYIIQLEDDLGRKSRWVKGRIKVPRMIDRDHEEEEKDVLVKGYVDKSPAKRPGGMIERVLEVMERHDTTPYLHRIKVNHGPDRRISITAKANDDKGLKEIRIKILDMKGDIIDEQNFTDLGKVWEGTSKPVRLEPGNYTALVRAIDTGNNQKERREAFSIAAETGSLHVSITPPPEPLTPTATPEPIRTAQPVVPPPPAKEKKTKPAPLPEPPTPTATPEPIRTAQPVVPPPPAKEKKTKPAPPPEPSTPTATPEPIRTAQPVVPPPPAKEKKTKPAPPRVKPRVRLSSTAIKRGDTIHEYGSGFTPNGQVVMYFDCPDRRTVKVSTKADRGGAYDYTYTMPQNALTGTYYYYAKDVTTNLLSSKLRYTVSARFKNGDLLRAGIHYYIFNEGKAYHIPNPTTFEALGFDWNKYKSVSQGDISNIQGPPIPDTPWGGLIRAQSGDKGRVYLVWQGRHHIPDPATARDLRGPKWDSYINLGPTGKGNTWATAQVRAIPTKAGIKKSSDWSKPHPFVDGHCTDYIARKRKISWGGHAGLWLKNAKEWHKFNFYTDTGRKRPVPGSIMVTSESKHGHVAFVESVGESKFTVSDWNYCKSPCLYKKKIRTLDLGRVPYLKGFIY
ncbi:MAG: CHAP domain-containing protein [Desulfobacteraceae bacterium]|nr:CHAP domain-containing protein [Desulfobacteraceae bacterium]